MRPSHFSFNHTCLSRFPLSHFPHTSYTHTPLTQTNQVHVDEPAGDILVFLTGQEEIDSLARLLAERSAQLPEGGQGGQELMVLPIYAALPPDQQVKVRGSLVCVWGGGC